MLERLTPVSEAGLKIRVGIGALRIGIRELGVGEGGGLWPEARHGGGPHHRLWARVEVGHRASAEIGS